MHKQDENVSKANGLKRGRAILHTSSDSEGYDAKVPSQKRAKTTIQSQKSAPTPGRSSKPGKLQQKGISAFLKKPEAPSAEPEDHLAKDVKPADTALASQPPVRQRMIAMMHMPLIHTLFLSGRPSSHITLEITYGCLQLWAVLQFLLIQMYI